MSELRVDNIVSQDGTAAPVYSQGVIVGSGKTFTVRGDVDFQSGANVSGAVTFSSLSIASGFSVTGVVTATSFSGAITGNVTGNVTGNADTATTATTATNAQGLTGTPSITVQDATVQGNLTVNGTTSTIDTVITEVDSLNVEGNVGIGTTGTPEKLTVAGDILIRPADGNVNTNDLSLKFGRTNAHDGDNQQKTAIIATPSGGGWGMHDLHFCLDSASDLNNVQLSDSKFVIKNSGNIGINSTAPRGSLDVQGRAHFGGGLVEKFNNVGTTLTAGHQHAFSNGNVLLFTGNESNASMTLSITGLHSLISVGETVAITVIITPNNVGKISTFQVDNVTVATLQWSGGSAPTAGASGRDVYTFSILKTGTATNAYLVLGAATNYA